MTEITGRPADAPIRVAFVSDSMPERNGVGAYYADLIAQLDGRRFAPVFVCPGGAASGGFHFPLPGDSTQQVFVPSPRASGASCAVEATGCRCGHPGSLRHAGRALGAQAGRAAHRRFSHRLRRRDRPVSALGAAGVQPRLFPDRRSADVQVRRPGAGQFGADDRAGRILGARKVSRIGTLLPRSVLETPLVPPRATFDQVLFAGRLAMEKRLHTVLEAAERLPDIRFVIAGDGPLKAEVEPAAHSWTTSTTSAG